MKRVLFTLQNLLLPGFGSAMEGHLIASLTHQGLLTLTFIVLCWFKLPDSYTGITLFAALLILTHFICIIALSFSRTEQKKSIRKVTACLCSIISISLLTLGIAKYHEKILGYSLYFVPSESMQPTLEPADLILVNTRNLPDKAWQLGSVIVFNSAEKENYFYVKRITEKPEHLKGSANDRYFVMGDNREHSADSRVFGLIQQGQVLREVKLVLLNLGNIQRHLVEVTRKLTKSTARIQ